MKVRIYINNRDRLTPLRRLIQWLWEADQHEIIVLDNLSTYPPLLEYYRFLDRKRVKVIRFRDNLGSRALWKQADKSLLTPPFILTDSDCVPAEECPLDMIDFLWRAGNEIKDKYQSSWGHPVPFQKIGPAFKLSNIPDAYALKSQVLKWEQHICGDVDSPGREQFENVPIYDAAIDTTFALYFDGRAHGYSAARAGYPFLIDHLDWHVNSARPTEEEAYYEKHAVKGREFHSWGANECHIKEVAAYCRSKQQ